MTWKHCLFLTLVLLSGCVKKSPAIKNAPRMVNHLYESVENNLRLPKEISEALRPTKQIVLKAEKAPLKERQFDINADQVDAQVFFMSLAKDTPYNIVVHPEVSGKISLQLNAISILQVLDTVRNMYGYDYKQTGSMLEILPASLQTRSFLVNYLDLNRTGNSSISVSSAGASGGSSSSGNSGSNSTGTSNTNNTTTNSSNNSNSSSGSSGSSSSSGETSSSINTASTGNFWVELKTTVEAIVGTGEGRKVAVSPLAGLIVVQAMPNEIRKVEDYLKTAELSLNRQVIIEAKILEVKLDDTFRTGVDWGLISGRLRLSQTGGDIFGKESPTAIDVNEAIVGALGVLPSSDVSILPGKNPLPAAGTGSQAFGGLFTLAMNYKNLASFVELLETQGKVQVLSSPRISTMNHQKALIKVGNDNTYVTGISNTTTVGGTAGTTNTPSVNSGSFFSGIALDVVPHIGEDNFITLYVHPAISNVTTNTQKVSLGSSSTDFPTTSTSIRESDSIIRAQNGQVVVIGGLMQDAIAEQNAGVPGLKNIPGLGKLFKQERKNTQKSELIILLRPLIVDNQSKAWNEHLEKSIENFESLE